MLPLVLLVFASVTTAASAQTPPPEKQRALDSLASVAAAVAGPDLKPNQFVTSGSTGHARALVDLLGFPKAVSAGVQLRRAQMMAQAAAAGSQLPDLARATLVRDITTAFDIAASHFINNQLAFTTDWFARRLTYDEVQAGIEFWSQPLGAKMARNTAGLTPAEREAIGRYVMDHPTIVRVIVANGQYGRDVLARRVTTTAMFDAEMKSALCPRLAADRIRLPSCTANAAS